MSHVLINREGAMGRLTLNRPEALNALTLDMLRTIRATLEDWDADPSLGVVVMDGAGPKAFCAGGDVAALHAAAVAKDPAFPRSFWSEEYALNDLIARYAKPIVVLVHGFCMGGGVGLAVHARHRIVGQSARIALPECSIGLVPDVGSTALLASAPLGIGPWMALTGARLEPRAAIEAGFADAFVAEEHWPALRNLLAEVEVSDALARYATVVPGMALPGAALRQAFAATTVTEILSRLADTPGPEARMAENAISRASPLAMAIALELQAWLAPGGDLRTALRLEYRAVLRALEQGDFPEGVRARIMDRDNAPRWRHIRPEQVTPDEVEAQLAPLACGELTLPELPQTGA